MITTLYNTLNPLFLYMVYIDSLLISNDKISIITFRSLTLPQCQILTNDEIFLSVYCCAVNCDYRSVARMLMLVPSHSLMSNSLGPRGL